MHVPGRIVHFVRTDVQLRFPLYSWFVACCCGSARATRLLAAALCCCCTRKHRVYEPRWSTRTALRRILVSADMLRDHMPNVVAESVQATAARVLRGRG